MALFDHRHPYGPFLFPGAKKIIVGTLPPPRFTTGELNERDVDFCYGSSNGMLWPILERIFQLDLTYANTPGAIEQRRDFLIHQGIGICDIVERAQREKVDASDLGMQQVVLRDLIYYLQQCPLVDTVLFMGGNSKNGPEYFFRKQLREKGLALEPISGEIPRIHRLDLGERKPRFVSLTAPSGAANRAVGSMAAYKALKEKDPGFTTLDFRVRQYRPFFLGPDTHP